MDDFLEQMLSASAWGEGVGINRAAWDTNAGVNVDSQQRNGILGMGENTHYPPRFERGDAWFNSTQAQPQAASHASLPRLSEGTGSGFHQTAHSLQSSSLMAPTWRQSYFGTVPPLPSTDLDPGIKPDAASLRREDDVYSGKRPRDDDDTEKRPGNMIHVSQSQQELQSGQILGDQSPLGPNPAGTAVDGVARPRVRARRGQATDPHSIAERNRRERIAERMKALQELVPDSNKTDKASMLDEIIGYVKFLQMQVKCLSMCRLGGAGAAAPLLADLPGEGAGSFMAANLAQASGTLGPSQDGMAVAERQVARLMDEDMSAAMQYLQSKGLCLMPISLATAISSTGARQHSMTAGKGLDSSGKEKQATDLQAAIATGSPSPQVILPKNGANTSGNEGVNVSKILKDVPMDDNANEVVGCKPTLIGGMRKREEPQR